MHTKWSKHKLGWTIIRSKLYLAGKYKICKIKTEMVSLNIQWDQNWQVFKQNKTTQKWLSQLSFRIKVICSTWICCSFELFGGSRHDYISLVIKTNISSQTRNSNHTSIHIFPWGRLGYVVLTIAKQAICLEWDFSGQGWGLRKEGELAKKAGEHLS